jgi:hypothetical protein
MDCDTTVLNQICPGEVQNFQVVVISRSLMIYPQRSQEPWLMRKMDAIIKYAGSASQWCSFIITNIK